MASVSMETIVSLCKQRGFLFQSSEIYGGLTSSWDYGPLGVELKNNVKRLWWKHVVHERRDVVGMDAAIIMHPDVWKASGHVEGFTDPLVDCTSCKRRFRADHLAESVQESAAQDIQVNDLDQLASLIESVPCPECKGKLTKPRLFNLMLKTFLGPVQEEGSQAYLRPETAQGIFVNFKQIQQSSRKKIPFGIAQIGKAFRNEITPGNFTFRTREFEQMELEFFCKPGEDEKWHDYWVKERFAWYLMYGIGENALRIRAHDKEELAHYAKATSDIEYQFPFGWSELEGIANRTDFDLAQHQALSKKDLSYTDEETKETYLPYAIEPSSGADRATLAFLVNAFKEEEVASSDGNKEVRSVLQIHRELAPVKVAILPLLSNNKEMGLEAEKLYEQLSSHVVCDYDKTGSIGRRYRRQDEIGTPYCVTIDHESLEQQTVTVRDRDSMKQERVHVNDLLPFIQKQFTV